MVKQLTFPDPDNGSSLSLWDIDARTMYGSAGVDVMLLQYLFARAPEANGYWTSPVTGSPGIAVTDVDGIWGDQTAQAVAWLEGLADSDALADHVIDPIPPNANAIFFVGTTVYMYKLWTLQDLYSSAISKTTGNTSSPAANRAAMSNALMGMPSDGQCPPKLAAALQAAQVPN